MAEPIKNIQNQLDAEVVGRLKGLTRPARAVAIATIGGMQTKEIAALLNVSDNNVRHIRRRMFRKYDVSNHVEFTAKILNPQLHQFCKSQINKER